MHRVDVDVGVIKRARHVIASGYTATGNGADDPRDSSFRPTRLSMSNRKGRNHRKLTHYAQREEARRSQQQAAELVSGLTPAFRRALFGASGSTDADGDEYDANWEEIPLGDSRDEDDDRAGSAEGVYRTYVDAIWGVGYVSRVPVPNQEQVDRRRRAERAAAAWDAQFDDVIDAFLAWRQEEHMQEPPEPLEPPYGSVYIVDMWSLHSRDNHFVLPALAAPSPATTLIRHGLLSNAPTRPRFAISLTTLEIYRTLRNRKPSLGIQPFVRAMCDLHLRPVRPIYVRQFTETYDIYLRLLRGVDARVARALGRDDPSWRLKHCCPACTYKLEDEPTLEYDILISIDGNNSLKRFTTPGLSLNPPPFSTYYVPRDQVDELADEVVHRVPAPRVAEEDQDVVMEVADTPETAGEVVMKAGELDVARSQVDNDVCVERWKANAPENKKGMFSCFDEAGLMGSICRHGFLLLIADMIRSGELAKYPLALLKSINEALPGSKLVGYDIGCAFEKTVARSSIAGSSPMRFVIPAMHGYAHNRLCQLGYHPMYTPGTGLEDFEGCERVFSASNECARLTRHSNVFHRHQALDSHFRHWDAEKYANLGTFLFNNYKQAIFARDNCSNIVQEYLDLHHLDEAVFPQWLAEEKDHLQSLSEEPEDDSLAITYVETLDEYAQAKAKHEAEREAARSAAGGSQRPATALRTAQLKLITIRERIDEYENLLRINESWTPASAEYRTTKKYIVERTYRLALDNLERLVVQRLFELSKSHRAQTGYRLRQAIAKHLQSRSAAIQTAVRKLNTAGSALDPPRPPIAAAMVLEYSFLAEFDLLRESRVDIRDRPWSKPATRILIDNFYKWKHAEEEIRRLDVEIRRVRTWMRDDMSAHLRVKDSLAQSGNLALSYEFSRRLKYMLHVNGAIMGNLERIAALEGFTGTLTPGIGEYTTQAVGGHTGDGLELDGQPGAEEDAADGLDDTALDDAALDEDVHEGFQALEDAVDRMERE